ncbi:Chloride channel, voltage gated [Metarhizium album ARSEF 1941]|uniref:Chloride channel, voltage gated n=1 Tax=Metarhizium album (strain ARSEF 1941) TaxID=1081103 RepID=A0A0B2X699_METAS|nr:Chloride channel, voltage gated [Metarhizium album ARSEF 1941]KHO00806.1 Chloride channel, voltage gated [Metarhizium album ARSEF 1941]
MSGAAQHHQFASASASASASSSSRSPPNARTPPSTDDRDLLDHDHENNHGSDHDTAAQGHALDPGPLGQDLSAPLSFKRRSKQPAPAGPSRFFSSLAGSPSAPRPDASSPQRHQRGGNISVTTASPPRAGSKDGGSHDWYAEGPGRRVAYEDMTAIDWIFEYTKERQRMRVLSSNASGITGCLQHLVDASQVWLVLVLTGLLVGAVAAGINVSSDWLGDLKLGFCSSGPERGRFYLNKNFCCYGYDQGSKCAGWKNWSEALGVRAAGGRWVVEYIFYLLFSTTLAYCAALLVQEYAMYAKHSGIPELKTVLGGFVMRRFLGTWTLITKSIGLVLAVSSGMWLGKEGPLQLSYYFPDKTMWQSFVCAMTAAVCLQAFDPFRSGKLVLYQTKYSVDWHGFEIVPYAILGVFGGVYGGLFIRTNMAVARWRKTQSWLPGPVFQVLAVALLTALINYPNFYMKVQSTELVSSLFSECSRVLDDPIGLCRTGTASAGTVVLLIFAAVLGFFLASITFGLQIPAGIILPSMAIGALTGRAVGIVMEMWAHNHPEFFVFASCAPDLPCITPGTYAIIGASAALAGVTRMTVSIVVIMFELTGALTYVLPIMVAVMTSKWVGDAFSRRGIYESWIHFNEYPLLDNSEEMTIPDIPASQIMTRIEDLNVLTATGHTIASLNTILRAHAHRGFPVISDPREAILLGYISRAELSYNIRTATQAPRSLPAETEVFFSHQPLADPRTTLDLRPWMDQTPLTLPSRTNLHLAVTYFQKLGLRYVLFADRGVLQGILTKKDVWYVLNGADETRRTGTAPAGNTRAGGPGGIQRAQESGEDHGLLRVEDADDAASIL